MFSFISSITRPTAPILAVGAAFAALALPSTAAASDSPTFAVSVVNGYLSMDSLSSTQSMHPHVMRLDEDTIRVTDLGATIQTGDRCLNVQDDDTVDCDVTGLTLSSVHFEGSPLGDSLTFESGWSVPVLANGWGGSDDLSGAVGEDVLHGGGGHDILRGKAGGDDLYGEAGGDTLQGMAGRDDLFGGAGHDIIGGGLGRDLLNGGGGDDRMFAKGDAGGPADTVQGGIGTDRATLDRHVDTWSSVERRSF